MKIFTKILALFLIMVIVVSSSCRKSNNNKYFYDPLKDTSAPVINISVPLINDTYNYGEDVHIVGTVTDLQTTNMAGKLQTLTIKVDELNHTDSIFIQTLLLKTPLVDAKEGFTFNEKMLIFGSANPPTFCRLDITASDYSNKITRDTVYFTIQ